MPRKCTVFGCRSGYNPTKKTRNNDTDEVVTVHGFPTDKEGCRMWIAALPNANLTVEKVTPYIGVCAKHWPLDAPKKFRGKYLCPSVPPSIFSSDIPKHFVKILDGKPLPNFPDPFPACPSSNLKSIKPRRQSHERNGSKSTSQIPPDSELCAVDGESQSELFDQKEPEQTPHLFLGYTSNTNGNGNHFQKKNNSVCDTEPLRYCSALFCSKNSRSLDPKTGDAVDMHPFPDPETDKERCLKWIKNLRNDFLNLSNVKSKKVCSLHFGESSYYPFVDGTCTLLPDAVPMLVTRSSEENAGLIIHLNSTIETLQRMLEEEQFRNEGLEEKVSRLEFQRDVDRKKLEDANENLKRVCFLASLDS